jgi:ATP-dependent protease Clp ATPase subunit
VSFSMGNIKQQPKTVLPKPPPKEVTMSTQLEEQAVVLKQMQNIARIFKASGGEIRPHFILTGPSGSGKSHLTEQLAEIEDLGFIEVNAAQLTKEGTAGNSLSKALAPLREKSGVPTIVFVDEFDKLFISGNSNSDLAHEVTHGVQNEFLKVLESKTTSVYGDYGKYNECSLKNALFVFAGAFNGEEDLDMDRLREFGLKVEFLGRVGLVYNLPKLSLDSMRAALQQSPLLDKYLMLYKEVKRAAVLEAVMPHIEAAFDKNTLGIRLINTMLHQYFINGGKLSIKNAKKSSFQNTTLTLESA